MDNKDFLILLQAIYASYSIAHDYNNGILDSTSLKAILNTTLDDFAELCYQDIDMNLIKNRLKEVYDLEIISINPLQVKKINEKN